MARATTGWMELSPALKPQTDAEKLRLLADWLDVTDRARGIDSDEAQRDLRRIADQLELRDRCEAVVRQIMASHARYFKRHCRFCFPNQDPTGHTVWCPTRLCAEALGEGLADGPSE